MVEIYNQRKLTGNITTKIVIIGGRSYAWTRKFIRQLVTWQQNG